jgi:hypothetical protein
MTLFSAKLLLLLPARHPSRSSAVHRVLEENRRHRVIGDHNAHAHKGLKQ